MNHGDSKLCAPTDARATLDDRDRLPCEFPGQAARPEYAMSSSTRIIVDRSLRHIFRIVSFFSVIALAAMVIFVFAQGLGPFFFPTAPSIAVVLENIPSARINGSLYENHRRAIPLDPEASYLTIEFPLSGTPTRISLPLYRNVEDPGRSIEFPPELQDYLSSPEHLSYTLSFPGSLPGLEPRIHINIPEPPYSFRSFITGREWRPVYRKMYGIFPMIIATLLSALGAVLVGAPVALLSCVLIAEFLPPRLSAAVTGAIELLAGIPSVVYGFFGLMIVVPGIQRLFGSASGSSIAAAIAILSLMILPTIVTIGVTALRSVPATLREASLALGATKMQTAWCVVCTSAKSGLVTGVVLGTARALGETMAVILVAGNSPQIPVSLVSSVRTLTATIALEMGYSAGRHNEMLFSIGIILFLLIFLLNGVIMRLRGKMHTEVSS
ncbi:phosphate ABC transporter permease subunit PstC [Alkalispirochaeta alkalica]|uniref:phosphate ABC transporter permease subunit PstC n=1 Tax=Alkalispirochaeta alkalica TaxID=46356 RepID=UPI0003696D41|nr:phosphate ABC transporter permease subunit PstC [Alkalispirochaeta alkalica]